MPNKKEMTPKELATRQEMTSVLAHPMLGEYLGNNAEGYMKMWREQLETGKYNKQPLDWKFFLLGIFFWSTWYAYRRMYVELILLFVVWLILNALLQVVFPVGSGMGIVSIVLTILAVSALLRPLIHYHRLSYVIIGIVVGSVCVFLVPVILPTLIALAILSIGKSLYYQRVSRFFRKNGHLSKEELRNKIAWEGGTCTLSAVIATLLFSVLPVVGIIIWVTTLKLAP